MSRLNLTSRQRDRLRQQLRQTPDARRFRRTLAVLEFDRGRPAADIAAMLGVTRQSVALWVQAYARTRDPAALRDREGRGRQPLLDEDGGDAVEEALDGIRRLSEDHGWLSQSWCWGEWSNNPPSWWESRSQFKRLGKGKLARS